MLTNSMTARGVLGAATILLCHMAAQWTGAGYDFEIVAPKRSLDDFPMRLGTRDGADIDLDPATTDILGAKAHLNREYKDAQGEAVGVHLAYWASPEYVADVAPHHPRVCYTGSGWEVLETRRIEIDTEIGKLPIEAISFQRNDQHVVTAHWYQLGDSHFTSRSDARGVHRRLWGSPQWPPTLKVLLQVQASSVDEAIPEIETVAADIFQWTSEF